MLPGITNCYREEVLVLSCSETGMYRPKGDREVKGYPLGATWSRDNEAGIFLYATT